MSLITSQGPSWQFIAIRVDSAKIKEITKTGVFSIDDRLSILTHEHEPLVALQNIEFVEITIRIIVLLRLIKYHLDFF